MKVTMVITLVLSFTSHIVLATEPLPLESHFSEDELQWLKEEGTATVRGKAYIKLADGSYKGCDGFNIELLPATSYSSERIQKTYGNTQQGQILISQNPPKFTPDPKAYHELTLKAKCGENDAFVFENVPQGEYFVMAFVIWPESDVSKTLQGGGVMKYLQVKSGDLHEVLLKNKEALLDPKI